MAPLPRGLRDLVSSAAQNIGRSQADADPFARILADNWFDSPESLAGCRAEELTALGIPLRFAQQICTLAGGGAKPTAAPGGRSAGRNGRQALPLPPPPPPQADQHRGGGIGRVRTLRVKECDPAFRARGSILGQKGRNVHHIQDETGVKVDLRGDSDEKMELVFSDAPSNSALEQAVRMGKDLLQSVNNLYAEWLREGGESARPGGGGGGGGGGRREEAGGGRGARGRGQEVQSTADAEFQHLIEIQEFDPAFTFRGKMLGAKGRNMREIESKTGAMVQLKGANGEPMRLELGAASPDALTEATELAEELVARIYAEYDQWLADGGKEGEEQKSDEGRKANPDKGRRGQKRNAAEQPAGGDFHDSLDVDIPDCDPKFHLRGRVLGAGGKNLKQIEGDTGARVELHGKDSEPLKLEISAASADVLESAVGAADQLINSVYDHYARWLEEGGAEGAAGAVDGGEGDGEKSKGKSRGSDQGRRQKGGQKGGGKGGAGELRKVLKLKECDPGFDLRGKLKGNQCENLHHVQDETGARLWVLGENEEPVRLEISANQQQDFDSAVQMAKDLIKTVFRDYDAWNKSRSGSEPPAKRQRA